MESVFFNLIKNAVEHLNGKPGETVRVRLYKERNRPCVAIQNRGEPISRDRLATFFERFNTTKKDKGGTGLGTTYAELITRAHGGNVRVSSNVRDGTTVTVLLPSDAVVPALEAEEVG
jgi:signal transduction histidine kinase